MVFIVSDRMQCKMSRFAFGMMFADAFYFQNDRLAGEVKAWVIWIDDDRVRLVFCRTSMLLQLQKRRREWHSEAVWVSEVHAEGRGCRAPL